MFLRCQMKMLSYAIIFFFLFNLTVTSEEIFDKSTHKENHVSFEISNDSNTETFFHPAFLSNVHEIMTQHEKLRTFGTIDGSVPDYQVVSVKLPSTRKKRHVDEEINFSVEIDGKTVVLNFKPTDGHLATRYTPIWSAVTDFNAYNNIRYDPLPNAMKDIGKFKMYQDVKWEAAIVIYKSNGQRPIIEGIVTPYYVIKSLPDSVLPTSNEENYHYLIPTITKMFPQKRSIQSKRETTYCVIFKVKSPLEYMKLNPQVNLTENHRVKRESLEETTRNIPETVYPEILLVVDHNAIRNQSMTDALRCILAFWNGVDAIYSAVNAPAIRLNIAGIIVSADDAATPYIADNTSNKFITQSNNVSYNMGRYFYEEQERFPVDKYDIILAMTTMSLCTGESNRCKLTLGNARMSGACSPQRNTEYRISGVGIFHYNGIFLGVDTAVHESAHLFGVDHDKSQGVEKKHCNGFVMKELADLFEKSFKWSPCSQESFRRYFSLNRSQCMDNVPILPSPIEIVMPGHWLTLDGQCRNVGFKKACQLPDISPCTIQGCIPKESDKCVVSNLTVLPGSKCGENKYCDLMESKCIINE